MQYNVSTLPTTLQRLVDLLKNASQTEALSPQRVKALVEQAAISEDDLMHYADFDHPVEDCYGRKLVFDNGTFEVMVMSWNPGDYSSVHNHGYTEWGVVQVFGHAQNINFCVKQDRLTISAKQILSPGDIVKVNNALIHQMGNPSSKRYVSLHVYGSNTRDHEVTADAKNFELEFDRISHTTGGAFFNLPDGVVYDFLPGIPPDADTFLHYAFVLLAYYNRQEQTDEIVALKQNLLAKMGQMMN